jgi:hypothetical protein
MSAPERTGPRPARAVTTTSLSEPRGGRRKRVTIGIGLGLLAVGLVGGAFGAGRMLAESKPPRSAGAGAVTVAEPRQQAYGGRVNAVTVAGSSATCQSGSSVDAAANPVSYEPAKAHDSDLTTAWRCDGDGAGQRLTITLPEAVDVAEVGLVPGYAKTDPASGVDRYAENNRIARVRWHLDDGSTFVQRTRADATDRSQRSMRIPATRTRSVVLEILRSEAGPRDTVAISEVRVAAPSG